MFGGQVPLALRPDAGSPMRGGGSPMREVASPQQEEAIRWNSRPSGLKLETADDVAAFSGNDNADDNDSLGDLSQFDFKKRIDDAVVGSMDRQYTELRDRAEAAEFMQHGLAAEKGRVTDQLSSIRKENESLRAQLARVEDSRQKAEHDKLIALNEKEGVEKRMAAVSKREKQLTVDNDKLSSDMFQATQGGKSLQSVARALHNDIKIRDQVEASLNKKVVALEKELVTTRAEVAANGAKCNETETRRLETAQRLEAQENETAEAQREIEKLADELCKSVDENAKLKSQWETFAVAMGKRDESMNALWNAKEQAANKGLESENTSKNLESIVNTQMQEIATAAESVKQMQRDRDKSSATMLETKSQNEKLVKELELSQAMAKTFMTELDAAREKAHSMKMKVEKLEDVCNQKDALVDMQKQAASTFKSELDALQGPLSDTTLMDSTAVQIRELQATVSNVCNQKQELSLEIQAQKVALQEVEDELKRTKDENKRLTEEHIKIETKAYHLQNNLQRSEYRILKAQATIYDASLSSPKDENAGMQETVKGLLDSQTKLTKERNDAHIQILSNEIKSRHSKSNLMHKQQQLNAVTTQKKSALAMNRRLLNDIEGLHSATSIGDRTLDLSKVKLRNASQKIQGLELENSSLVLQKEDASRMLGIREQEFLANHKTKSSEVNFVKKQAHELMQERNTALQEKCMFQSRFESTERLCQRQAEELKSTTKQLNEFSIQVGHLQKENKAQQLMINKQARVQIESIGGSRGSTGRNSRRSHGSNRSTTSTELVEGKLKQTLRVVAEQRHRIVQLEQSLDVLMQNRDESAADTFSQGRRNRHEAQATESMKHNLAKFQNGYHFAAQLCTHLEQQLHDLHASNISFLVPHDAQVSTTIASTLEECITNEDEMHLPSLQSTSRYGNGNGSSPFLTQTVQDQATDSFDNAVERRKPSGTAPTAPSKLAKPSGRSRKGRFASTNPSLM